MPPPPPPPPPSARDWAEGLPGEIMAAILHLLPSFADHLRFAAVCSPWRSVAMDTRRRHCSPTPTPWVLLEHSRSSADAPDTLHFLSPSDGMRLPIPLPYAGQPQCVGNSPDGWLILDGGGPRRLHAINPLTGRMLLLPSPLAVTAGTRTTVHKVAMSTCPYAGDASLDVVDAGWPGTAVFAADFTDGPQASFDRSVALARAGDRRWEALHMGHLKEVIDLTYHQGKFYILGNMKVAVDDHYAAGNRLMACVGVVDFGAGDPLSTAKVTVLPLDFKHSPRLDLHFRLIGSPSGDLLLAEVLSGIYSIRVFQVDLHTTGGNSGGSKGQKVVEVTGLGSDQALLVGDLCSMTVSTPAASQLKGNSIYWIPLKGSRAVMGVFSFDTGIGETCRLPHRNVTALFVPGLL